MIFYGALSSIALIIGCGGMWYATDKLRRATELLEKANAEYKEAADMYKMAATLSEALEKRSKE